MLTMRRSPIPEHANLNRNKNIFTHLRNRIRKNNSVSPDNFLVSHLWMQEEERSGVEIIELSSTDNSSCQSSTESVSENPKKYSQAWSYINNGGYAEQNYQRVNHKARDRRRVQKNRVTHTNNNYCIIDDCGDTREYYTNQNCAPTHRPNCFTIINNRIIQSESSSDEEYALGVVEKDDDAKYWDHVYNEHKEDNEEQRLVWIYSIGNRGLLREHDYSLNIPTINVASTSSNSPDEDDVHVRHRIASPIPPAYIPRLDLSVAQTLSTVAEVKTPVSSTEKIGVSKLSSWVTSKVKEITKNNNKIANVLDWMSLSPRNEKRKYNTNEVTLDEDMIDLRNLEDSEILIENDINTTIDSIEPPKKVLVEIHNEPIKEENVVKEKTENVNKPDDLSDTISENEQDEMYTLNASKKPHIDLSSKISKTKITSPIEKLEGNNWIIEEVKKDKAEIDNEANNNVDGDEGIVSDDIESYLNQRLFLQNVKMMKPSPWVGYLPIATSENTLHLSFSCSTIHEKPTWFQWVTQIFKCCRNEL